MVKHLPRSRVVVNTILNGFIHNTNLVCVKMFLYVAVPPLLHLVLLEEGVILLRNWMVCVVHGLSDILKFYPRYYVIESDGGTFWGCNGILQKEVFYRVANIAYHDDT